MPTVQDEEESLCLLASDLQKDKVDYEESKEDDEGCWAADENQPPTGSTSAAAAGQQAQGILSQGNAEKAFFNVCKTNEEEDDDDDDDEDVEVMNDIIGTLEADHVTLNGGSQVTNEVETTSTEPRNSRSLVVDIHLPPASEDDDELEQEEQEKVMQQQQPPAATSRPCKHEVNRFQRCYSDGSQASPKKKAKIRDQLRHSHFGDQQLSDSYSMREENLDRIETVICDNEQNGMASRTQTGTKAKRQQNFRGSTISEGSSNVGLLRGAAFGIQQEFMQLKNSLLEGGKASISDAKQKRKSDSEVYASDSPSPLVKFEINDQEDTEDETPIAASAGNVSSSTHSKDELKVEVKKPHKFIYPRLNFFGTGGLSSSVGDSCATASLPTAAGISADAASEQQLKLTDAGSRNEANSKKSAYTFFAMDSEDDFDPYCSDLASDVDTKRDLLGHGLENQNVDIESGSCLSASSSTVSMPVCRICQLPGMEPSNPLISPCRCLGSIRYVHNNCLLKWLEVSSRRRSGPPCCELCQYQYLRHKKFVISHWRFPECSLRDKFLHFFFIVNVCLMIACAAVTIICFKEVEPVREPIVNRQPHIDLFFQDGVPYRAPNYHASELTVPELITVSCGILFFLAFFLAIYVEVKAKHTVYQLICKFFYMNHEWSVEEYDRKRDIAESRKKKEKETKKRKFRNNRRLHRRESSSSSRQTASSAPPTS